MILLRQGKPQEARALADANRIDAHCPFVPLHMGLALVAANGDAGLAVRALQRALGPRGLAQWVKEPRRAWSDALPENRSYVRRLAVKYDYTCPLLGGDLLPAINRGRFALGQAHYRLGQYAEAADVYARLLQDSPPTAEVLRAHGLALAKLERYDQAYKQLRIALEQEPGDHLTAAYLALCGALGKPTQEEDRPAQRQLGHPAAVAVREVRRRRVRRPARPRPRRGPRPRPGGRPRTSCGCATCWRRCSPPTRSRPPLTTTWPRRTPSRCGRRTPGFTARRRTSTG